jgi:hypothetical protein
MNHCFVRPLRLYDEADKAAFIDATDRCGKDFPKDVFSLPSTRIMVASTIQNGREAITMYQPQFISLNLGSLIPVGLPSASKMATAQHQLFAAAYTRAHLEGLADLVAFSNDEATRSFSMRHGLVAVDGLRRDIR